MTEFYIIIATLIFSAFFSGIETAFLSVNKLRMELKRKKGGISSRINNHFLSFPTRFIGTALVGTNISLVIYGIVMASIIESWLRLNLPEPVNNQYLILPIQTVLATLIVLVTSEFLPKNFFMLNPYLMLNVFALPMFVFYILLYPLVYCFVGISKLLIRYVFKLPYKEAKLNFGVSDLQHFISDTLSNQSSKKIDINTDIFKNTLDFNTVKVKECMIPRTDIVAIDVDEDMEELVKLFHSTNLSRVIVYKSNIDNVIGFTHTLEVFKKPKNITQIMYPISIVPETYYAKDLLNQFTQERKSIALVVDEYGGTAGIVTIEDIIEEIFGEIKDEHDLQDEVLDKKLDPNTYLLSAKLEIDYLNEKYHFNIPDGEYETLGGYIISIHEDLPQPKEKIEIFPYLFEILEVAETRIISLKMTLLEREK